MRAEDKDYLAKKAEQLGLWRGEILQQIQTILDEMYPDSVKAYKLEDEKLWLRANGSSTASDVRINQLQILEAINTKLKHNVEKLIIIQ